MSTVVACQDCDELYLRQEVHRCEPTTAGLPEYMDAMDRRVVELQHQVVELQRANGRYRALAGTWREYAGERGLHAGGQMQPAYARAMMRCASEVDDVDG